MSADQIIVAAQVTQEANDVQQLEPMLDLMQRNLSVLGASEPLGTVLLDAGYWSEENATGEHAQRYDLLIATRNRHKQRRADRERDASEGPLRSTASASRAHGGAPEKRCG